MKQLLLFISIAVCTLGYGQTINPIKIDSLVFGIIRAVNDNYVIAEKSHRIKESFKSEPYYSYHNIDSMVNQINNDLFLLSNDKHLFLQYRPEVAENLIQNKDIHKAQDTKERKEHYGFEEPRILNGNIGYMQLRYFAEASHAQKEVLRHIKKYRHTKALIIDLRNNPGGNGTMIQLLSGVFLPDSLDALLKINYKSGRTVLMKANKVRQEQKFLNQPIYILCGPQTFSAAEAFAMIMQHRDRAVLIGDTTAGAGNVAGPHAIGKEFVLTVPVGIIVDPLTNTGWEHVGVIPDIIIEPSQALEKAIQIIESK